MPIRTLYHFALHAWCAEGGPLGGSDRPFALSTDVDIVDSMRRMESAGAAKTIDTFWRVMYVGGAQRADERVISPDSEAADSPTAAAPHKGGVRASHRRCAK